MAATGTKRGGGVWMDRPNIQKNLFRQHAMTTNLFTGPLFTKKVPIERDVKWTRMLRCQCAFLTIYAKAQAEKLPEEADIKLGLVMELMARHVPDEMILPDEQAVGRILDRTKYLLQTKMSIFRAGAIISYEGVDYPLPLDSSNPIVKGVKDMKGAFTVLRLLFTGAMRDDYRKWPVDTLLEYYCAMATRGNMTEAKINRLTENIREQTGKDLNLDKDRIRRYYTAGGKYITETNVASIFEEWLANLSEEALSLRLIIEQAQYGGLTQLVTVGRAHLTFPDFPWDILDTTFPGESESWSAAMTKVKGNVYYGYCHNLGTAAARHYINLAYAAKELLIRSGGNDSLKNYVGWAKTCKSQQKVIKLITAYLDLKTTYDEEDILRTAAHPATLIAEKWRPLILGEYTPPTGQSSIAGPSGSQGKRQREEVDDDEDDGQQSVRPAPGTPTSPLSPPPALDAPGAFDAMDEDQDPSDQL